MAKPNQNKKIRFLRYILRRKQCSIITIVEIILMIVLAGLGIGLYFWWQSFVAELERINKEDAIIDAYPNGTITFNHCNYVRREDDENKNIPFNTQFCNNRMGKVAFAYRYHTLVDGNKDTTCLDLNEQIYCHEDRNQNTSVLPSPFPLDCPGLNEAKFEHYNGARMISILSKAKLQQNEGKIFHAGEIFIKCPQCNLVESPQNVTAIQCSQKITTIEKGWPWFAELCNDSEKIECEHDLTSPNPFNPSSSNETTSSEISPIETPTSTEISHVDDESDDSMMNQDDAQIIT